MYSPSNRLRVGHVHLGCRRPRIYILTSCYNISSMARVLTDSRKRHSDVYGDLVAGSWIIDVKLGDDVGSQKGQELGDEEEKDEDARADGNDCTGRCGLG